MQQAIFGGGCFWCQEPVFRALDGVLDVLPGYCGGSVPSPTYQQVCQQDTGHIEVNQIQFDPARISYRTLLEVFFGTHDPTTPNRQGHDVGPQYASVIFYQDDAQHAEAKAVVAEVQALLPDPVCTQLRAAQPFWPAEPYHQQYYQQHPEQGYCQVVIAPKMAKFRQRYANLLKQA